MVSNRAIGIADYSSLWKDRKLRHLWYLMTNNKDPNALILSASCSRKLHMPGVFNYPVSQYWKCFHTLRNSNHVDILYTQISIIL